MKKTQNYQLSQWDATDRILREDFNGDNAKIDAAIAAVKQASADAIAAVRAACPYQVIRRITTSAQADQVDIYVGNIDFTQYLRVDLFLRNPAYTGAVKLTVNHCSDASYTYQEISGARGGSSSQMFYMGYLFGFSKGTLMFYAPAAHEKIMCRSITFNGEGGMSGQQFAAPYNWNELNTFNLIGTQIPAGTEITLCGVKA